MSSNGTKTFLVTRNMSACPVEKLSFNAVSGTFEPKKVVGGAFIKGPLPLDWITSANSLPGKAGAVGLAIWFLVGVKASKTVKLTRQVEQIAGCHRKAVYAAVSNLEEAGLISVQRSKSARATVTVIFSLNYSWRPSAGLISS